MSSLFKKIQDNNIKFEKEQMFKSMTPADYERSLEYFRKQYAMEYNESLIKLKNGYEEELRKSIDATACALFVELMWELATQMNAFSEEDDEIKTQIIDKMQEIYENTAKSLNKYTSDEVSTKEFMKKKKKLEKYFGIEF